MTGSTAPRSAAGTASVLDHAREMAAAVAGYLRARLALAGIEAKEAAIHYGVIIALFAAASAVMVFGYLFLCIAMTVLLAQWLRVSPGWVILGFAGLHFLFAISAVAIAASRLRAAMFTHTLAELKKDQEWLNRNPS